MDHIISIQDVSMCFKLDVNHTTSLKEWIVSFLEGKHQYRDFYALKKVSLDVKSGEVLGVIGHNGSGKSTLLKIVSGIYKPTSGRAVVSGRVAPMLELGSGFDMELSGRENIFLNGAILGFSEELLQSRYEDIVAYSELGDFIDQPLKTYSSGMVMRLAFSIATLIDPEILIVDEILAVGDTHFQEKSRKKMLQLMASGTTVLFVSHSLQQIRELCTRVVWLDHGELKMIGDTNEVCDQYEMNTLDT